ncbi:hypothetical protein F0562_027193 [Nyssa sinensis]|uniref:Uncharacterized protein n=1 Tax=Nyssa sinensis TaxID=561372 RepID=A0A5J5B2R5_9ASTE|nr:hypothetical protein F0562_027193 [Nyssa sinensis]
MKAVGSTAYDDDDDFLGKKGKVASVVKSQLVVALNSSAVMMVKKCISRTSIASIREVFILTGWYGAACHGYRYRFRRLQVAMKSPPWWRDFGAYSRGSV